MPTPTPHPTNQDIVIVGASGDLSSRKLIPALYNLFLEDALPEHGVICGTALVDWDTAAFIDFVEKAIQDFSRQPLDHAKWPAFAKRLRFVPLTKTSGVRGLIPVLKEKERLVYLAVPPGAIGAIVEEMAAAKLVTGTSIVIEKPFGFDVSSAQTLNARIGAVFPDAQVYRIDHYLGKETVQNLLVFRFGNAMFERVWNRDAIDHIEITVGEALGVEHRGSFYEETGALRDIVQNHLLQVVSVVAMDPPAAFDAESIQNEKRKVFRSIEPINPANVIRGQYTKGLEKGSKVLGYREEDGVNPKSETETYFAARLHIDSWRWAGVPFYIRTGKRLPRQDSRITIVFREVPLQFFQGTDVDEVRKNVVTIRLQPREGISISFTAKIPGPQVNIEPVQMDFSYDRSFKVSAPEAYERLLHDALMHDHTLFIPTDVVERAWEIVQPIIDTPSPIQFYPAGSWGPEAADAFEGLNHWHMEDAE